MARCKGQNNNPFKIVNNNAMKLKKKQLNNNGLEKYLENFLGFDICKKYTF